jgi:hypothetical protein
VTISTYATLQSAVRNWSKRSDTTATPDARIQEAISLGEDRIRQEVRCRQMEATTDLTITGQRVSLPTGFIGMRRIYLSTDPVRVLEYISPNNFWQAYAASQGGTPAAFTIEGDEIVFGPSPSGTFTGKMLIYKLLALSDSNTTSSLLTFSPGIYLFSALVALVPYTSQQNRLAEWEAGYQTAKAAIAENNRKDRFASSLRMRGDSGNP